MNAARARRDHEPRFCPRLPIEWGSRAAWSCGRSRTSSFRSSRCSRSAFPRLAAASWAGSNRCARRSHCSNSARLPVIAPLLLSDLLAPAEFWGDKLEDAVDGMGVVVHAQLIRNGQEQGVGGGDGLVGGELFDEHLRL